MATTTRGLHERPEMKHKGELKGAKERLKCESKNENNTSLVKIINVTCYGQMKCRYERGKGVLFIDLSSSEIENEICHHLHLI